MIGYKYEELKKKFNKKVKARPKPGMKTFNAADGVTV